jgi:hypothetical protein
MNQKTKNLLYLLLALGLIYIFYNYLQKHYFESFANINYEPNNLNVVYHKQYGNSNDNSPQFEKDNITGENVSAYSEKEPPNTFTGEQPSNKGVTLTYETLPDGTFNFIKKYTTGFTVKYKGSRDLRQSNPTLSRLVENSYHLSGPNGEMYASDIGSLTVINYEGKFYVELVTVYSDVNINYLGELTELGKGTDKGKKETVPNNSSNVSSATSNKMKNMQPTTVSESTNKPSIPDSFVGSDGSIAKLVNVNGNYIIILSDKSGNMTIYNTNNI